MAASKLTIDKDDKAMTTFDGSSSDPAVYSNWIFKVQASCFLKWEGKTSKVFKLTERADGLDENANMCVYSVFAMYATGDALRVVKEIDMGDGRAVYVRFNEEYLRTTGVDRAARVAAAMGLNIPYTTASGFRTEVLKLFQLIADTNITEGDTTFGISNRLLQVLISNSLPEEFNDFVLRNQKKDVPLLDYLQLMCEFARQSDGRNGQVASITGAAMAASRRPPTHSKPPVQSDKSAEYCTKCKKSGHSNAGCFGLHPELLAEYRAKHPLRERGRGKKGKKADKAEAHAVMPGDEELNIADLFCITDATAPVVSRYEYTFGTYQVFDGVDMCCATDIDIHEVATAVPAPYTTVFPTILANPAPTVDMLDDMEGMPIHESASVCPDWSVIEQSVYQQQQFSFEPLLIYRERDLYKTDIRVESVPTEECFVVTSVDPAVEANVQELPRPGFNPRSGLQRTKQCCDRVRQ